MQQMCRNATKTFMPVYSPYFSLSDNLLSYHYSEAAAYANMDLFISPDLYAKMAGFSYKIRAVDGNKYVLTIPPMIMYDKVNPNLKNTLALSQSSALTTEFNDIYKIIIATDMSIDGTLIGNDARQEESILTNYLVTEYDGKYYYYATDRTQNRMFNLLDITKLKQFRINLLIQRYGETTYEPIYLSPGKRANILLHFEKKDNK